MTKFIIAAVSILATSGFASTAEFDAEKVSSIWKERETLVKTVRAQWKVTMRYPKGGFSLGHPDPEKKKKFTWPLQDFEYSAESTFLMDDIKVRHAWTQVEWNHRRQELVPVQWQTAFDGQLTRNLIRGDPIGGNHGFIDNKDVHFRDGKMPPLRPVIGAFRGRTLGLSHCNPHALEATGRTLTFHGHRCLEYLANRFEDGERFVWLSPEQDWLIVREVMRLNSGRQSKIDVRYVQDAIARWVPASWEVNQSVDNRIADTFSFTMLRIEINVAIPHAEFAPEFPPDVRASDLTHLPGPGRRETPRGGVPPRSGAPFQEFSTGARPPFRNYIGVTLLVVNLVLALTIVHLSRRRRRTLATSRQLQN